MRYKLTGLDQVLRNLELVGKNIRNDLIAGMVEGTIIIRRSMEFNSPLTPVDLGNLRASWYVATPRGLGDGISPQFKTGTGLAGKARQVNVSKMTRQHRQTTNEAEQSSPNSKKEVGIVFGFSANYAPAVHEMEAQNWSRPGSGRWFFKTALNTNEDRVLKAIQKRAKIDPNRIKLSGVQYGS